MGVEREASGDYTSPPLTAEQMNARELECAQWQAEAALQQVAKAAERAAAAAAKVAHLKAVHAQFKRDREAFETAKATRDSKADQQPAHMPLIGVC